MTIRLLCAREAYGVLYPANSIVTLDSATESGLIAAKEASSSLTGGYVFTPRIGRSAASLWDAQNRLRTVDEMLPIGDDMRTGSVIVAPFGHACSLVGF